MVELDMTTAIPTCDFARLRGDHSGGQEWGFEELCCQLARLNKPAGGTAFVRKGRGGDDGVECVWSLDEGTRHGWQAKFIFAWSSQLANQIRASFRTALKKDASLTRYIVCLPFDLPAGHATPRGGKKSMVKKVSESARDKWDQLRLELEDTAKKLQRSVEIDLWDGSKLRALLTGDSGGPALEGMIHYWFGEHVLTREVLKRHVDAAIQGLGRKYNPKFHVNTETQALAEATCWPDGVSDELRQWSETAGRAIVKIDRDAARLAESGQSGQEFADFLAIARATVKLVYRLLRATTVDFAQMISLRSKLAKFKTAANEIYRSSILQGRMVDYPPSIERLRRNPIEFEALFPIRSWPLVNRLELSVGRMLLIKGSAGTGKSHIAGAVAFEHAKRGHPVVLIQGVGIDPSNPTSAIKAGLDLHGVTDEALLGALACAAQVSRGRAAIIIDAINESINSTAWAIGLSTLIQLVEKHPELSLIVTCRSEYVASCGLDGFTINSVSHLGFGSELVEAWERYFDSRGISRPPFLLSHREWQNPLRMYLVSEALFNRGLSQLPATVNDAVQVLEFYCYALDANIARVAGIPYESGRTWALIQAIAKATSLYATAEVIIGLTSQELRIAFHDIVGEAWATCRDALVHEGLLLKIPPIIAEGYDEPFGSPDYRYDFAFQWVRQVLIVHHLVAGWRSATAGLSSAEAVEWVSARLADIDLFDDPGLLDALANALPESLGIELPMVAPKWTLEDSWVWQAFANSLSQRNWERASRLSPRIMRRARRCLIQLIDRGFGVMVVDALVSSSMEPCNPFNADWVSRWLYRMAMPDRDAEWSVRLAQSFFAASNTEGPVASEFLCNWALGCQEPVDRERARLAMLGLGWMLCTSHRPLRDTATKALARLMWLCPELAPQAITFFLSVDDPYIRERVLCAAYGSVLLQSDDNAVARIASVVFDNVFACGAPEANVLTRDWAYGVIAEAKRRMVAKSEWDQVKIRPPFNSAWPLNIPSDAEKQSWKGAQASSIYGSCFDSDFNWYTLNVIKDFSNVSLEEHPPDSPDDPKGHCTAVELGELSKEQAARWILKRAAAFGWTSTRFEEFERSLGWQGSRNRPSIERIGKKYQYAALHELIARLTDNIQFLESRVSKQANSYKGAWQLGKREVDPCLWPKRFKDEPVPETSVREYTMFPDWLAATPALSSRPLGDRWDWLNRTEDVPANDGALLHVVSKDGNDRMILAANCESKVPEPREENDDDYNSSPERAMRVSISSVLLRTSELSNLNNWLRTQLRKSREGALDALREGLFGLDRGFGQAYQPFLGEYPHHESWQEWASDWCEPQWQGDVPIRRIPTTGSLMRERSVDQSLDQTFDLTIPSVFIGKRMDLRVDPKQTGALRNEQGDVIFEDPSALDGYQSGGLIDQMAFSSFLSKHGLTCLWLEEIEKQVWGGPVDGGRDFGEMAWTRLYAGSVGAVRLLEEWTVPQRRTL